MRAQVADVIGLVGHTFFCKREERPGYAGAHIGHCVYANSIISAEGLEAGVKYVQLQVRLNPVVVVEFAHGFGNAHAGVGEQHRAAVKVIEHSRRMEVAASGYVDISEAGETDIVAVGAKCRVHLAAIGVILKKIA